MIGRRLRCSVHAILSVLSVVLNRLRVGFAVRLVRTASTSARVCSLSPTAVSHLFFVGTIVLACTDQKRESNGSVLYGRSTTVVSLGEADVSTPCRSRP